MATRVAGKDEGNGKSGKSHGYGDKEGNCEEEGDGERRQQQDNSDRDNNNDQNDDSAKLLSPHGAQDILKLWAIINGSQVLLGIS
jgi:hypothetical protein